MTITCFYKLEKKWESLSQSRNTNFVITGLLDSDIDLFGYNGHRK
jgi:hypothetical protein